MPNLFPTSTSLPAVATSDTPVVQQDLWGVAPLFNPTTNQFLFDDSNDLVLGNEATSLSQRIIACLITPRTRWPIHSPYFGSDFWTIFGKAFPPEIVKAVAEKFVRQAVRDSRITGLSNFIITVSGKIVTCQFTISTTTGYRKQFESRWSI